MLPGFGASEAKAFVPIFQKIAAELTLQWNDLILHSPDQSVVVNVASWLSRATMDSIGEAAFDYQFGALSNTKNEFMEAYLGLMSDTLGCPTKWAIFMQTTLPIWMLQLMSKHSSRRNLAHARYTAKLANKVTRELVQSKSAALFHGQGNKDILSLLVKANMSHDAKNKLTEEEMLAQVRTILLAGHETSATSMCWVLLELALHPEVQTRLREEIRRTERVIQARGGRCFTALDLENMQYLNAVLKESMRFHPALYQNYRQAARDDALPLSKPIQTNKGLVDNIPIAKGTKIILSIAAYNRNKDVFGEDADVYNPDRWLKPVDDLKKGPQLGVYSNLLTLGGGVRSCIGWKFALHELQSLTADIINNFELFPTPDLDRLRREACLVMLPTLEGEQLKGANLPLKIGLAARD
jgi:cytochrome P450